MKAAMTADGVKFAHELLAKLEGLKSYGKRMRQAEHLDKTEYDCLCRPLLSVESIIRDIVKDREARHEQAGGIFAQPEHSRFFVHR